MWLGWQGQPDTGAGAWLLQEEGGRWAGWLSNNSRLQIRGQGVLVAAGTEGLSACTASSETCKLSAGCCLEGRGDLQEEPVLREFLAEES